MLIGSVYCSCTPITISGRPSPVRSASAGIATISPPSPTPESSVKVTLWVPGSTACDLGGVDEQHREPVDRACRRGATRRGAGPAPRRRSRASRRRRGRRARGGPRSRAWCGCARPARRRRPGRTPGRRPSSPAGLRWRPTTRTPCRSCRPRRSPARRRRRGRRRPARPTPNAPRWGGMEAARAAGDRWFHHGLESPWSGKPASSDRPGPRKAWIAPSSVASSSSFRPSWSRSTNEGLEVPAPGTRWGRGRTRSGSSCTKTCFCISAVRPSPEPPCAVTTTRRRTAKRSSSGRPVAGSIGAPLPPSGSALAIFARSSVASRPEVSWRSPVRLAATRQVSTAGYRGGWSPGAHSTR